MKTWKRNFLWTRGTEDGTTLLALLWVGATSYRATCRYKNLGYNDAIYQNQYLYFLMISIRATCSAMRGYRVKYRRLLVFYVFVVPSVPHLYICALKKNSGRPRPGLNLVGERTGDFAIQTGDTRCKRAKICT